MKQITISTFDTDINFYYDLLLLDLGKPVDEGKTWFVEVVQEPFALMSSIISLNV